MKDTSEEYFQVICVEEYTTLQGDGMPYIVKKGTIYTVIRFFSGYKIEGENSFIIDEQLKNHYMTLKDYRESKINEILE